MTDSTNQTQLVKVLVSQTPNEAKSDLTATLDAAATISAFLCPLVSLAFYLTCRQEFCSLTTRITGTEE